MRFASALALITLVTSGSLLVRLCWSLFAHGRLLSALLDGMLMVGVFGPTLRRPGCSATRPGLTSGFRSTS